MLGAIGVFVIDRAFKNATIFAAVAAALTYLGFMHGEKIGFGESPVMALSYAGVAVVLFGCWKFGAVVPKPAEMEHHHGEPALEPAE
jgi:AGZA family xanthine/uracil permease-like MFS transporter